MKPPSDFMSGWLRLPWQHQILWEYQFSDACVQYAKLSLAESFFHQSRIEESNDPMYPTTIRISMTALLLTATLTSFASIRAEETDPRGDALSAEVWRQEHRIIDLHLHIEGKPERFERALRIMNSAGIGLGVELGSGAVTAADGGLSDFEQVKNVAREVCPGRFVHYMILDYHGWDDDDWSDRAVAANQQGPSSWRGWPQRV